MRHLELASLVVLFALAGLIVLMLVAAAMPAIELVKRTVLWRAGLKRELASDWWPAFEREFHYYAARQRAAHEQ